MTAALIIIAVLALAAIVLYTHHRLTGGDTSSPASTTPATVRADSECCGQHAVCERDSLLAAVSDRIEYYDDEELDIYAGREPQSYTQTESEQVRNVMMTLQPDDIAGWARSIQLRGITLPYDIRDELILLISEARTQPTHA